VTCPPGKKHWHGATDKTAVTHIAIQESKDGKNLDWLEKVADEQYFARLADAGAKVGKTATTRFGVERDG
jgi:hypothetical protein